MRLQAIERDIVACERCPELRAYCARVAAEKRRAYAAHDYWGKPVPGFGDPRARILLVGLAPGAHGSNRTGRQFTGDASGAWLFRSLHRFGFASTAVATDRDDGLHLHDAYISAVIRCAPPDNKPTREQRRRCLPYLEAELEVLSSVRVVVSLGKVADDTVHALLRPMYRYVSPRVPFRHGAHTTLVKSDGSELHVLASYHPSQQNTSTKRLTQSMLDDVFERARELLPEV